MNHPIDGIEIKCCDQSIEVITIIILNGGYTYLTAKR